MSRTGLATRFSDPPHHTVRLRISALLCDYLHEQAPASWDLRRKMRLLTDFPTITLDDIELIEATADTANHATAATPTGTRGELTPQAVHRRAGHWRTLFIERLAAHGFTAAADAVRRAYDDLGDAPSDMSASSPRAPARDVAAAAVTRILELSANLTPAQLTETVFTKVEVSTLSDPAAIPGLIAGVAQARTVPIRDLHAIRLALDAVAADLRTQDLPDPGAPAVGTGDGERS
ncbi:MAG: hypothetical protein QM662_11555 [Gordonia sp. (in: high G+C Gram-positive bacteria)]